MAETLKFKLYPQATYETPRARMRWYQSADGQLWDTVPVDEIIISSLPVSGIEYTWDSLLADANKYHTLKSVDISGVEASSGLVMPPMANMIKTEMMGLSLLPKDTYSPGEEVNFLFRLNDTAIPRIGNQIRIDITANGGGILDTVYATRIGSLYSATWIVPLNIDEILLSIAQYGDNPEFVTLYDRWNLIGGSTTFQFNVNRHIEDPTEDNCIMHISLNGVTDSDGIATKDSVVLFTTKLTPYYTTVHDVRACGFSYMEQYDDFTIMRKIINTSRFINYNMAPDTVYHEEAFKLAVRNYARLQTAYEMILPVVQQNKEAKRIDTFAYEINSATPQSLLDPMKDEMRKYALFIWGGGRDTPFLSKLFVKGIFDPGRPNLARAEFDESGWFPYLNSKTNSYSTSIDGDTVEFRGERMVAHRYLMNRYNNFAADSGDVGYLARI
jgi:hypothetical protein